MYQVVHLPRKAGYSKEKLNSELATKTKNADVKQLLKSKNFPNGTTVVIRINKPNNQRTLWTIPLGSGVSDKEDNNIVLRSKDNATTKFFKISDFKGFFKDTVAIIDTISIELFIRDDRYPDDQYQLVTSCNGSTTQKSNIPFSKGKLVFTNGLISNCTTQPVSTTIINASEPAKTLASFYLSFLTADQKETLIDMAAYYKEQEPQSTSKEIVQLVANYATAYMGKLYFPQLVALLNNTQQ